MTFTSSRQPGTYAAAPPPVLPGADRLHYERELQALSLAINQMAASVKELQDYANTNTVEMLDGQDSAFYRNTINQTAGALYILRGNNSSWVAGASGVTVLGTTVLSESVNIGGFVRSAGSQVFVPVTGYYRITSSFYIGNADNGRLRLYYNGIAGELLNWDATTGETRSLNDLKRLTAGDYVEIRVEATGAPASVFFGLGHSMFSMEFIGA